MNRNTISLSRLFNFENKMDWNVHKENVSFDEQGIKSKLMNLKSPCYIVKDNENYGISLDANRNIKNGFDPVSFVPSSKISSMGDPDFTEFHGTKYCLYGGAMAKAIASEEMVISLANKGFMGSFGAGGLTLDRIEQAIFKIKSALTKNEPYIFNLLHNPIEPAIERKTVDLYLKHKIPCVEAAAYIILSLPLVHYRIAGLERDINGQIIIKNKVIGKVSRREVASRFMSPAPIEMVNDLLEKNLITKEQLELSQLVPMADDVTVEADSGGHTDNRSLVALLPSLLELRDVLQEKYQFNNQVRVGAAGGIGTPEAALAAFMMGASYVVTGSINQCCIESGSSDYTRDLLSQADMADVTMAPAADMFEMGVRLQVLKRGTLFPMRAQKLYDIYKEYDSIEEIPREEIVKLEKQLFKRKISDIWNDTVAFFEKVDPTQIQQAKKDPKKKMALIFRWYLGLASHWANKGEEGREADYQIWCGPSMGAFNMWVKGSYLEKIANRKVADVANQILTGASYLKRVQDLKSMGVNIHPRIARYKPVR
ncbi:MAG: PfaD family polyunsaturated fatty acid/polyketide biosynthesis protein [Desulfobacterales bacterium]|nr:PfaD family polyunsaturated fatty acid/polyketide biosynthesis protein [Desulfobacterales bacterium]